MRSIGAAKFDATATRTSPAHTGALVNPIETKVAATWPHFVKRFIIDSIKRKVDVMIASKMKTNQ
jgi:hypothetical protein